MRRRAAAVALLMGVYALMLGSAHPLDLALGAVIAVAVVTVLDAFLFPRPVARAQVTGRGAFAVARWSLLVLRQVFVGTWDVALVVLGLRPLRSPGVVELPIDDRTRGGAVASAFAATLSPGEFVVDFDWERQVVLMHLLDASDPDAVRAGWRDAYERHQQAVVP